MESKKSLTQSKTMDEKNENQKASSTSFVSSKMNKYPLLSRTRPVGLCNLGNTCFLNSALQCLSHVTPLTLFFLHDLPKIQANGRSNSDETHSYGKVVDAYLEFLQKMWEDDCKRFSPDCLRNAIGALAPQFATYQQQDAQEFLVFLLNTLDNELQKYTNADHTIITELFCNTIQSTTVCRKCQIDSKITSNVICFLPVSLIQNERSFEIHFIPFRGDRNVYPIAISANRSVQDLVQKFMKKIQLSYHRLRVCPFDQIDEQYEMKTLLCEISEDKILIIDEGYDGRYQHYSTLSYAADNLTLYDCIRNFVTPETIKKFWLCKKQCDGKHAVKQMQFFSLARVLIVQLKRFTDENGLMEKIETYVDFPINDLDASRFDSETSHRHPNATYDLIAVSNHMGSVYGGHYTAYARQSVGEPWYLFDDSLVTRLDDQDQIVTKNAYILIYLRRELTEKEHKV